MISRQPVFFRANACGRLVGPKIQENDQTQPPPLLLSHPASLDNDAIAELHDLHRVEERDTTVKSCGDEPDHLLLVLPNSNATKRSSIFIIGGATDPRRNVAAAPSL